MVGGVNEVIGAATEPLDLLVDEAKVISKDSCAQKNLEPILRLLGVDEVVLTNALDEHESLQSRLMVCLRHLIRESKITHEFMIKKTRQSSDKTTATVTSDRSHNIAIILDNIKKMFPDECKDKTVGIFDTEGEGIDADNQLDNVKVERKEVGAIKIAVTKGQNVTAKNKAKNVVVLETGENKTTNKDSNEFNNNEEESQSNSEPVAQSQQKYYEPGADLT